MITPKPRFTSFSVDSFTYTDSKGPYVRVLAQVDHPTIDHHPAHEVAFFPYVEGEGNEAAARALAAQYAYHMNVMLDLGQVMYPVEDPTKVYHAQYRLERAIIANMIHHMQQHGFEVWKVDDGEERFEVNNDLGKAMEVVDSVDESVIFFHNPEGKRRSVVIIGGNGEDVICDWSDPEDKSDGFSAAMEAFDAHKIKAL